MLKNKIGCKNSSIDCKRNGRRVYAKLSSELPKLNLNAAGIDIGSQSHYVAVPEGRDEQCVREFKSYTSDLYAMASWLREYVDHGQDYYNNRYRDRVIKGLRRKAAVMGFELVEFAQCVDRVT